jgi:hypothetical protein
MKIKISKTSSPHSVQNDKKNIKIKQEQKNGDERKNKELYV